LIGEYNPYNGVTNEICHVFVAEGLEYINKFESDESEEFEILEMTGNEINKKIKSGEIWDGMTLAAWGLYIVNN
jgi:hypothetical protein